ncbi:MAG: hypothetical protein HS104_30155 [Polyangiaceae bacterium]|nr:hypothetical protein [Polyangiaceae bacterium]MCL4753497.1 hypothetical protein [Myxococcales bacterium]
MPNAIQGLEAFIEAWDASPPAPASSAAATTGESVGPDGQINLEGSATCQSAAIFVPSDPSFVGALEPGVRELCLELIGRLDCVTYSSCQGHRAAEPGGRYRRRHVGIVPRDQAEASRLEDALERVCSATNRSLPHAVVRVLLVVSQVDGDLGPRPCFDLELFGDGVDEDRYFREVELLTREFLNKLRENFG